MTFFVAQVVGHNTMPIFEVSIEQYGMSSKFSHIPGSVAQKIFQKITIVLYSSLLLRPLQYGKSVVDYILRQRRVQHLSTTNFVFNCNGFTEEQCLLHLTIDIRQRQTGCDGTGMGFSREPFTEANSKTAHNSTI